MKIKTTKKRLILTALIDLFILFEFNNIPPFHVTDVSRPPAVYSWLAEQKGDFIIAEYPIGEATAGETYVELDYLFYQRVHRKKLINGAIPGTKAYDVTQKIIRIADEETPKLLSSLGVKYIVVHLDRYREGTNKKAVDIVGEVPDLLKSEGLRLVKRFGSDEIYEVIAEPLEIKADL